MSNVVTKGTNRPAAAARSRKHAQRTPLPPRAGQVEQAVEVLKFAVQEPDRTAQYGRMTLAQLRTRAEELGLTPPKSATRGRLLEAILMKERSLKAETQAEQAQAPQEESLEPKGLAKANRFAEAVRQHGWTVKPILAGQTASKVVASAERGPETIIITWDSGVFVYDESAYIVGDRNVKPRNVSAACQIAARPTSAAQADLANSVRRFRRKVEAPAPLARGSLPFELDAPESNIKTAVLGRMVTWFNRLTNTTESARVSPNPRWLEVRETAEGRVLLFCSKDGGFKACRLAAIQAVKR